MFPRHFVLFTGLVVALAAPACDSGSKPAPRIGTEHMRPPEDPFATPAAGTAPRGDVASPSAGSIRIEERILRACGNMPEPHFAFDSAAIEGDAARALDLVARCFREGPLQGRGMILIGRADPRGETMYNFALGENRATSVARFIENAGLPADRIKTLSRGELDATGTDEQGWSHDRRVDILLGD